MAGVAEIRKAKKVNDKWTYDYAYADQLKLSQGAANLTFTEAIQGKILLDNVDTYAVAVTGAAGEFIVTFDEQLKLSKLAAVETLLLTVDSYEFWYEQSNGAWELEGFHNYFMIAEMLERAVNRQDAAYSEAVSIRLDSVDSESPTTIAVLAYESTTEDTATVIADITSYLGALRPIDSSFTVNNITYAGVVYTWNAAATSLRDGWVDSLGNTLASKIAANYNTTEQRQSFDFTTKNAFGEVYNFSVTAELGGF